MKPFRPMPRRVYPGRFAADPTLFDTPQEIVVERAPA